MKVPFLSFNTQNGIIGDEIRLAFERVFQSNWYILGKELKDFERTYAQFNAVSHCIGVGNGLDALHIALKSLNIGFGDEVIVPSNTYIATWLAMSYTGATIIPVEPDILTYNIDAKKIAAAITSRTKAIMPVHLYGQACEMDEIMSIANKNALYVIEDNAQAQGAKYNGQITGSFGNINATSFYPTKNLGAFGDAGALTTNDEVLAYKAAVLRNYGSEKKYQNEIIGVNSRLDEMQAAFILVKLKHLLEWTSERNRIALKYNKGLANIEGLHLPLSAPLAEHVYHLYVVRTKKREKLQQYLSTNGIETAIHYPIPPHLQKAYEHLGFKPGDFPIAEELADTCLSLPLYPGLSDAGIETVIKSIKSFYAENTYRK